MTYYIQWSEYCIAGNPAVNRTLRDKNRVVCGGWTRIEAPDEFAAEQRFVGCFPEARIEGVST